MSQGNTAVLSAENKYKIAKYYLKIAISGTKKKKQNTQLSQITTSEVFIQDKLFLCCVSTLILWYSCLRAL